jgi:hypothetical protein
MRMRVLGKNVQAGGPVAMTGAHHRTEIFVNQFNLIWLVHPLWKKHFPFHSRQISSFSAAVPLPARGALRDRHERWVRNAMDAAARETNDAARVRRSRVVPMPRRWHQARDNACRIARVTVAKEPGHRGEYEGNR